MRRFTILMTLLFPLAIPEGSAAEDDREIAFNTHCRNCHSIKKGDNRLGPSMDGIFGAKAGQVEGYGGYSGGLKGFTWDEETLDRFMAHPSSLSPGTNMIFPPVADAAERKKIIEFLKSRNSHRGQKPQPPAH